MKKSAFQLPPVLIRQLKNKFSPGTEVKTGKNRYKQVKI